MEEKIIIKGIFSKLNFFSVLFCIIAVFFFILGIATSIEEPVSFFAGIAFAGVALLIAYFFYTLMNKCEITVTDKRVFGKAAFGKRVDLPIDMISSVGISAFNGISVATSSGRINFMLCKNKNDIFNAVSNLLLERQNKTKVGSTTFQQSENTASNADELKKYKDLLDSGIITQEEFDLKKKQLLGL